MGLRPGKQPCCARLQLSCMDWRADAAVVTRMQYQIPIRKATDLVHDSLLPLSNNISPPKNPTTRRRRYTESCYRRRSHGHRLVDPLHCHQLLDLSSQIVLVSRLSDRMLAKAGTSDRSPRITLGGSVMTARHTRPSRRQPQRSLVRDGKISLTLLHQLQKRTVETLLQYVPFPHSIIS